MYEHKGPRIRKLSREQRLEAVARYEDGEQILSIAQSYDVTPQAIAYHLGKMTILRRDRRAAGMPPLPRQSAAVVA